MALFQSKTAKRRDTPPVPYSAGMVATAIFEYTFDTAFTAASDILEIGALPATARIISATAISENLAATTKADIGTMDGDAGQKDATRALTSDLLFNTLDVAGAATDNVATATTCLAVPIAQAHRGLGATLTVDQTAAANKKLKLVIQYIY